MKVTKMVQKRPSFEATPLVPDLSRAILPKRMKLMSKKASGAITSVLVYINQLENCANSHEVLEVRDIYYMYICYIYDISGLMRDWRRFTVR